MSASAERLSQADVYAIPVVDRWLLFAPQTWTAAVVNRAALAALARPAPGGGDEALPGELQQLRERLLRQPDADAGAGEATGKLVIIPTRACNMHCVYCDFGAATAPQTTLDPRLACRLVDHAVAQLRARGEGTLRVHFFGGEPLVARTCTETVVHYARALCARTGLVPWFELTTNGFFDSGLAPFVGDYFDSVVVSVDGVGELHDYNRRRHGGGGTYAAIAANLRRLAGYPVELCLRMCVTNRSVSGMAGQTGQLCREFEFDVLSFEMLAENDCARQAGLRAPDPGAFAAGVFASEAVAGPHGVRVVHGPSELVGPRASSCPLGQGSLVLTPEGRVTGCYLTPDRWTDRGLDLDVGRVDALAGVAIDAPKLAALAALVRAKPRCARCFCRHTCAGGCHVDQTPPGCSPAYDHRCRAIRAITAGRLLRSLGCEAQARAFAESPAAMETVAGHPDDRLACWRGTP